MASPEEAKRECALERQNSVPRKPKVAAALSSGTPQEQSTATLRCPRCDSSNTKFCYYNNYSLSQPRHFCKTCRRYWTNGGALRNVPIGGGCRKNKKLKSSSSPASRLSDSFCSKLDSSFIAGAAFPSSFSDVPAAGFRSFPAGLSPVVDFQISGLSSFHQLPMMPFSSLDNVFNTNSRIGPELPVWFSSSYPSLSSSSSSSTSIASGLYFSSSATQEMAGSTSVNPQSSLAASIESLSSLNQDLHWKLQQQRYATLLGPTESNTQKETATFLSPFPPHSIEAPQVVHRPQPVSMQSQEFMLIKSDNIICSRKDQGDTTATELLSGNSYDSSIIPDAAKDSGSGNGSAQAGSHSNLHGFQINLP